MKKEKNITPTNSWRLFGIMSLTAVFYFLFFLVFIINEVHSTDFSINNVTELIVSINSANDEITHPGPDTINMTKGTYILTKVDNDTNGPNGLPSITSEITINGNDSKIERSEVKETPEFRIFHIDSTGKLLLTDLTVSNGKVTDGRPGGGLYNRGLLKLNTCVVKDNQAGRDGLTTFITGYGGGLYSPEGDVIIDYCTFSDNRGSHGAGIYNGGMMSVGNSTINGNDAHVLGTGGGINNEGTMTITSSTISGNTAMGGGGIDNGGPLTIISSTITDNNGGWGGGGISSSQLEFYVKLQNTIIALNTAYQSPNCTRQGAVASRGHNLIGEKGECGYNPDIGDIFTANPMLGPLSDNGGPTLTHALLAGSPAIDAGDDTESPKLDQRGYDRKDGNCDIGAYEFGSEFPDIVLTGPYLLLLSDE